MAPEVIRFSTRRLTNGAALVSIGVLFAVVELAFGASWRHLLGGLAIGLPVSLITSAWFEIRETGGQRLTTAPALPDGAIRRGWAPWVAETAAVFTATALALVAFEVAGIALAGVGSTLIMPGLMGGYGGVNLWGGVRIRRYERRAHVELATESRRFRVNPIGVYTSPLSG